MFVPFAYAGYWLTTQCDEIFASQSARVGSINTYIAAVDDSRAWEMKLKLFSDDKYKAMGGDGWRKLCSPLNLIV